MDRLPNVGFIEEQNTIQALAACLQVANPFDRSGCWGPCYTMSSHAALGVVRAGVAVLKGKQRFLGREVIYMSNALQAQAYESIAFHQAKWTLDLILKTLI